MRISTMTASLTVAAAFACVAYAQEPAAKAQPAQASEGQTQLKPGQAEPGSKPKGTGFHREMRQLDALNDGMRGPAHGDFPPPPPPPGEGGPNFDFMRRAVELSLSDEERSNLKRLAFEKPDDFSAEISKRFQAVRQKHLDEMRKTADLQKAYHDAKTPEERQKALESVKALVKEQFDRKMELNKRRLAETEENLQNAAKRLEEFKRKYEERKAKAGEIMAERVKELTKDPDLGW